VLIAPTLVQGVEAPTQIVRTLQWLDGRDDIDIIIVSRGGEAIEDLWAFNDEMVARSIFAAVHPIIVGVGHEIDFAIADFVADVRASTPSEAAERAVPDKAEISTRIQGLQESSKTAIDAYLQQNRNRTEELTRALSLLSPRSRLDNGRQQVDYLSNRMERGVNILLQSYRDRLSIVETTLFAVNPRATLSRGYAIVRKDDRGIVSSVGLVTSGDAIQVQVSDGEFNAVVK